MYCKNLDFIIYTRGGGSWYFRPRSRRGLENFSPIARMGHLISRAPLLLLYLRIKLPHTHYHTHDKKLSNLWGVIVTTCLLSSKDTFTYFFFLLHVPTEFIRNFCIAHNTLCLRFALFCVTIFSQFLLGVTVVPRQIEAQAYAEFGGGQTRCIMGNAKMVNGYLMLILNRTAKEHEWSDPRKWEKNQGQARKFDSRSGRGRKPRKRYVFL